MRRARVIGDGEIQEAQGSGGSPDRALHVKSMIARLPNKQRQALVMRKLGGLEYGEIAAALGCSEEAARAGVYQALRKLKAE